MPSYGAPGCRCYADLRNGRTVNDEVWHSANDCPFHGLPESMTYRTITNDEEWLAFARGKDD